jgi:hypothetical protein
VATRGTESLRLLDSDQKRVRTAIRQLRVAAFDIDFDVARSRLFRFGSRTFVVAFSRDFFGRGKDFEHLRGRRSVIGVVGQAQPVHADRFEAYRLIVLDLRSSRSAKVEVRRTDGSIAHTGPARIAGNRLIASLSMAVPRVRLAGSIEGSIALDGKIRLTKASLSIRTAAQAPERERISAS